MPQRRAQRQLELIEEFEALCAGSGIECWLRGGWALDFLLGRVTRPHADIDLFIWAAHAPRLIGMLKQHGYEEVAGPPPEQQRNLVKAGEELHVTLLERNEFGVVTAGGRWADSTSPDGMLDGPVGRIADVRCRVISGEAQLWAKEEVPKALGHARREHDPADIALLRQTLSRATASLTVRPFKAEDAALAARLLDVLSPPSVQTAESLLHRQSSEPERARRRSWVAVEGEDVVGFATAYFQWFGGESGKGRVWVGVRQDRRRRGIGSALWDSAVAHLCGARKHTVEVDDDPAGLAFVERRGFRQYGAEVISRLDPRTCRLAAKPHEGFRTVRLRDVLDRDRELFRFYNEAGGIPPGDPENRVTFEEWRRIVLGNPLLDQEASVVVVDTEGQIVSLSWLLVDHVRRRAENEWTATLPRARGRGLARLAKLATIRWAAEHGIAEIVTGNDPDNPPMRELNRLLGYRELFLRRDLERPAPVDKSATWRRDLRSRERERIARALPPPTGLAAPSLLAPAVDARFAPGEPITFDWTDVAGAASYTIQIDDSETFSAPLTISQTVTASQLTTNTLLTTRMWWRVRANDASGAPGAWSTVRRFELRT
jgi:GNAT superfamily N-acetyltransferase